MCIILVLSSFILLFICNISVIGTTYILKKNKNLGWRNLDTRYKMVKEDWYRMERWRKVGRWRRFKTLHRSILWGRPMFSSVLLYALARRWYIHFWWLRHRRWHFAQITRWRSCSTLATNQCIELDTLVSQCVKETLLPWLTDWLTTFRVRN